MTATERLEDLRKILADKPILKSEVLSHYGEGYSDAIKHCIDLIDLVLGFEKLNDYEKAE